VLPVLFIDTVNRWHYSAWWKLWPGRNRVVFLEPVEVTNMGIEHLPQLKEMVKERMAAKLQEYGYPKAIK
jgi:1-acyl-sn-glycerol-3-phosphate acyltransferase